MKKKSLKNNFRSKSLCARINWILGFAEVLSFANSANGLYGCCKKKGEEHERQRGHWEHNGLQPRHRLEIAF